MPIMVWCLMIVAIMPVIVVGIAKGGGGYDNREPRLQVLEGRRRRAHSAHLNCFEAIPLFLAALYAADVTNASHGLVDALSVVFVLARIGYVAAYISDRATLRSALWTIGFFSAIAIFLSGFVAQV